MCWIRTHLEKIWDKFKYLGGESGKFNFRNKANLNMLEDFAIARGTNPIAICFLVIFSQLNGEIRILYDVVSHLPVVRLS